MKKEDTYIHWFLIASLSVCIVANGYFVIITSQGIVVQAIGVFAIVVCSIAIIANILTIKSKLDCITMEQKIKSLEKEMEDART